MTLHDQPDGFTVISVRPKEMASRADVPFGSGFSDVRAGDRRRSDPAGHKIVDVAFQANIAELKAAGATLVDPIVIPNLKKLLATRERDPIETEAALELYLARLDAPGWSEERAKRRGLCGLEGQMSAGTPSDRAGIGGT